MSSKFSEKSEVLIVPKAPKLKPQPTPSHITNLLATPEDQGQLKYDQYEMSRAMDLNDALTRLGHLQLLPKQNLQSNFQMQILQQ